MTKSTSKTFTLVSIGLTGAEWIQHLEEKKYNVSGWAKEVLNSPDFIPSPKGTKHEIAIIKGDEFSDEARTTQNIRNEASMRGYAPPNAEVACLIRENFSDEDIEAMGLIWIVAMHEPIKDSDGDPGLLNAHRDAYGPWLNTTYDDPDGRWFREGGFAFAVSQVSSPT